MVIIAAGQQWVGTGHFEKEDDEIKRMMTNEIYRTIHQQNCPDHNDH